MLEVIAMFFFFSKLNRGHLLEAGLNVKKSQRFSGPDWGNGCL